MNVFYNSASAMIEEWVWSGNHMIRLYSFLLELCQLLSQQSCQGVLLHIHNYYILLQHRDPYQPSCYNKIDNITDSYN